MIRQRATFTISGFIVAMSMSAMTTGGASFFRAVFFCMACFFAFFARCTTCGLTMSPHAAVRTAILRLRFRRTRCFGFKNRFPCRRQASTIRAGSCTSDRLRVANTSLLHFTLHNANSCTPSLSDARRRLCV